MTNIATGITTTATIVERDMDRDLAVLRVDSPVAGMRHFTRSEISPSEGMPAHLIGFPNWSAGRPPSVEHTTITAVFPKKSLTKFEVNSLIRKGNSGGPIASATFELLGVAQEGATQAMGNNEGLSVDELDKWLQGIDLTSAFSAE